MSRVPGLGIARGMLLTLRRIFQPKVTVQYPEERYPVSPRHRGRLQLLYDEYGALKCETCFQCAQACPIECIDMGGTDTKGRFHLHWGPPEQYAERRSESALRRSGRPVPDPACTAFEPVDLAPLETILAAEDYDPRRMPAILERTQAAYGHLPVATLKHISHSTGAWYAEIYGTASSCEHLRFEAPATRAIGLCRCAACTLAGGGRLRAALEAASGTELPGTTPDGALTLAAVECHGASPGETLVTVDGVPQRGLSPEKLAGLATSILAAAARPGRA